MANTIPTTLTRRAALTGGASIVALAGAGSTVVAFPGDGPDAELLRLNRRLEVKVPHLRELRDNSDRLWEVWKQHPDFPTKEEENAALYRWHRGDGDKTDISEIRNREDRLAEDTGFRQASDAAGDEWGRFTAIRDRMFDLPASTTAGVLAKLSYAHRNLSDDDELFQVFECPDISYLENAIADLERLTTMKGGVA
jgi:hypothetical protein